MQFFFTFPPSASLPLLFLVRAMILGGLMSFGRLITCASPVHPERHGGQARDLSLPKTAIAASEVGRNSSFFLMMLPGRLEKGLPATKLVTSHFFLLGVESCFIFLSECSTESYS
jgi:uncharacterized membrane protein YedE/YeeE